jgi:hypothetical protein
MKALQWLKENNRWYRHITMSMDRLSQLPENGNLEDNFVDETVGPQNVDLPSVAVVETENVEGEVSDDTMGISLHYSSDECRSYRTSYHRCSCWCTGLAMSRASRAMSMI